MTITIAQLIQFPTEMQSICYIDRTKTAAECRDPNRPAMVGVLPRRISLIELLLRALASRTLDMKAYSYRGRKFSIERKKQLGCWYAIVGSEIVCIARLEDDAIIEAQHAIDRYINMYG